MSMSSSLASRLSQVMTVYSWRDQPPWRWPFVPLSPLSLRLQASPLVGPAGWQIG